MQAIYSATATSTGGRDGRSVSSDNKLDLSLSTPKELGGAGGEGTNPEQLFAAGYSACFIGALKLVASQQKINIPADVNVTAIIGIGPNIKGEGFTISADLEVNIPGVEASVVEQLVEAAHQVCPYSNATRGNIDVNFTIK
jgi:osmotically inducible protein OsmC